MNRGDRYWPEIDGLRAVTVLAVLVFHFDRRLLPGGFTGVDIFFVISGFLIAGLLLRERDAGRFAIARFYQRRIARIAPAALTVIAVTLIGAWWVYDDQDFAATGAAAAFASVGLLNFKLVQLGNYFVASPDAQPLTHLWSLAVEEQFYLLFPFYLYAVTRWTRWPLAVTLGLGVVSLALCIAVTPGYPVHAFYMLPTRGWELLAGAALAMLRWRGVAPGERAARALPWAGAVLILASVALIPEGRHFPGALALVPVLGAAAILATAGDAGSILNRWLSRPLPVAIGKRSYALYLWHWPVFSLVDYQYFAADFWARALLKVGLTLLLTELGYRIVEVPARRLLNRPERRWFAWGGFAVAAVALVAMGTTIRSSYFIDSYAEKVAQGGSALVVPGERGKLLLFGDSQATMYGRELMLASRAHGWAYYSAAGAGLGRQPGERQAFWRRFLALLDRERPDVLVIAIAWDGGLLGEDGTALATMLDLIRKKGTRIVFVQQIPRLPAGADREAIRRGGKGPFMPSTDNLAEWQRARGILAGAAAADVKLVDPLPLLTAPDGSILLIDANGRLTYQDPIHLTSTGARRVTPALTRAVEELMKR